MARTRAAAALLLSVFLSACGAGAPTLPDPSPAVTEPTSGGDPGPWVDGETGSSSTGFTVGAPGDLILRDLSQHVTPDGCTFTLSAEGSTPLGYSVQYSDIVEDGPPSYSIALSGFADPHPTRILRAASEACPHMSLGNTVSTVAGLGAGIDHPVQYRAHQPDAQTLVIEFQQGGGEWSTWTAPWDHTPPPEPWQDAELLGTEQTVEHPGTPLDEGFNEFSYVSIDVDVPRDRQVVALAFNLGRGLAHEASYVEKAVDPDTGEDIPLAGDAILRVDLPELGTPPNDTYLDWSLASDVIDLHVTDGEDGGAVVWVGVPEAVPFNVVSDESSKIYVVLER